MRPDLSSYRKVTKLNKAYDARYDAQSVQNGSRGSIRLE